MPDRDVRTEQGPSGGDQGTPPLVVPLFDAEAASAAAVGGKALGLSRLAEVEARVPEGFVVTAAALRRFLGSAELTPPGPDASDEDLTEFQARVRETAIPEDLARVLAGTYRDRLGPGKSVAVRSSGALEDLAEASFAGIYETRLNVRGVEPVLESVRACWASLWAPRVRQYADARHREGDGGTAMAVIVQEMVDARVSGVLFTVNPLDGREEEMLVESAFGLGEAVVSGRVDADRFVLDAGTGRPLERTPAHKDFEVVTVGDGTREVPLPPEKATALSLSDAELRDLAQVGRRVQAHFGRPMDVEWAYDGDRLFLLQARPVTSLSFSPEVGEWTTADFRDGGVSSDVCTPFMWSLYDEALSVSMPEYFKRLRLIPGDHRATWGRMFFGRPYWNLGEVKGALSRIPGYDEASFHADMGVEVDPEFEAETTPTTLRGVLSALPSLLALERLYRERLEVNRAFVEAFQARIRAYDLTPGAVAQLDDGSFLERYRSLISELYLETETNYFYTIYNTSNAKLDLEKVLKKVGKALGEEVDAPALLGGLRDLSHLRPMKEMHRIVRDLAERDADLDDDTVREFARRWRHRGRKELDIRVPRWSEDLDHVRAMMESALAGHDPDDDPRAREEARHRAYRETLGELEGGLRWRPLLRVSLRRKLRRMRRYAWWREEMRDHSTFVYYLVRLWTLDAARRAVARGRLEARDDVWFLSWRQVIELLDGRLQPREARTEVARGRYVHRSFRNFDNPDEIGAHFRSDDADPAGDDVLRGTPCAGGVATGRARVLRSLDEAARVQKGEVLVARFTDPGWTPLFGRIAGVVTETGGVLSHAAVISREYGIPAVLGVPGATEAIGDGDRIRVHGGEGLVEIRERAD